jgi:hypothetical protein
MCVLGFVPIFKSELGYEHVLGGTPRCRYPGSAERWLDGLVQQGVYRGWEPEPGPGGDRCSTAPDGCSACFRTGTLPPSRGNWLWSGRTRAEAGTLPAI